MVEPDQVMTALGMARSGFDLLARVKDIPESGVISALFNWDGYRVSGSKKIHVEKMEDSGFAGDDQHWWYHVKEVREYTFLRFPVVDSGVDELVAHLTPDEEPEGGYFDAMYWRWIAKGESGHITSGSSDNVRVQFVVVGYKVKSLLSYFKS